MLLFKMNTKYYELIILFSSSAADQSISANTEASVAMDIVTHDIIETCNALIK